MKSTYLWFIALTAPVAVSSGASAQVRAVSTREAAVPLGPIPDQYICGFKGSMDPRNALAEARRIVEGQGGMLRFVYRNSIKGFAAWLPAGAVQRIKAQNSHIVLCENDQVVTVFTQRILAKPGSGSSSVETTDWGVTRVKGGNASPIPGAAAWVIDSGIDLDHPDLYVDVARSRSFLRDTSPDDQNGHGTHVAGTIAAIGGNGIGVVGVAPGAPVVAVRVLDRRGSGTVSGVIAGVDYVAGAAKSGDVANMSLGGGVSTTLDAAVLAASEGNAENGYKKIWFTIAAGNDGADASNYSPARVNGDYIRTVSAFKQVDTRASFSNFGPPVDVGQPGVDIRSTYKDGGYATLSGTSMAAPHLAGLLLLGSTKLATDGTVIGDNDGSPDPIIVHCTTCP